MKYNLILTTNLSDSPGTADVTVFPVHVVTSRAGVVSDPDTEVLDLGGRAVGPLREEMEVRKVWDPALQYG